MDATKLAELKAFVEQVEKNPAILQDPKLHFFRKYLERLGATLPKSAYGAQPSAHEHDGCACAHDHDEFEESDDDEMPELHTDEAAKEWEEEEPEEIEESDVELDTEGVVVGDDDPPQKMGDPTVEVTDEMREEAQEAKIKATEAVAAGNIDEALAHYTDAILANPTSAIPYSNRAGLYIKLKKPNAAIRDAEAALKINPDSAKGYKFRGEGNLLLGNWELAAKDLYVASKLDFDEQIQADLKKVEPNVHKLDEHRRKYDRLRRERAEAKIERERQRRKAEAKFAYDAAKKQDQKRSAGARAGPAAGGFPGGFPGAAAGGFPGAASGGGGGFPGGGFPGGFPGGPGGTGPGGIDMNKILSDPELMAAFQDPDVMAALQDVMTNPANLAKHQGNPKVAPVIAKMFSKFAGGAPGAAAAAAGPQGS